MSGPELCPKCKGLHFKTAPCIKRPVGRPKTITDMKAYKALKAREYRLKRKGGDGWVKPHRS